MESNTRALDRRTCLQLTKSCRTLSQARELHARMQPRLETDVLLSNMVVHMYGKCRSPELARRVFDRIQRKTSLSWDVMMSAYARNGHIKEAKKLFDAMPQKHMFTRTAMLVAYARYGYIDDAKQVFDEMPERDLVSWTTMLDAYARNRHIELARTVFDQMPERDMVCWTSLQTAYAQNGHLEEAKFVFDSMPDKDVVTWTVMVGAYAQNGYVSEAKAVFDSMEERNFIAWTLMLCLYSHKGDVKEAKLLFDRMPEHDFISWNSMMFAYARTGHFESVLDVFHTMNTTDLPDDVCMVCVLAACVRCGTVSLGRSCFHSIQADYGLSPSKQHFSCMIDLLSKARHLQAAEELIHTQPFLPIREDWRSLLAASTSYKDVRIASQAMKSLVPLDPQASSPYVILCNTIQKPFTPS